MTNLVPVNPAELYLARRSTDASRATAESALNAAARALGATHHSQIDWALDYARAAMIRSSLNAYEPAWARAIWSTVREVAREARRLRLIDADTLASILELPAPRGGGTPRRLTPTDDDIASLLDTVERDTTLRGRRDAALLAVLSGGLRRAEACALHVDDWNSAKCRLVIRCGKGRQCREVPLHDWAAELLDECVDVAQPTSELLIAIDRWGNLGGALSGTACNEIIARLCVQAGVETFTCHAFRRHAITEMAREDLSLACVLAGHASVTTTIRAYDVRGVEDLAAMVKLKSVPRRRRPHLLSVA